MKPYLDSMLAQGVHDNYLVVRKLDQDGVRLPAYEGYRHLFTADDNLDAYDLVLTPTFLRDHERTDRTRAVQLFHGMSDKPFTYERDFSNYLLCLCAGRRQVERLLMNEHNRIMRWAIIGYPKFVHPPTLPRVFDNDKKTVIYCPTWRKQNISSLELFLDHPGIVAEISRACNLIVKPHPNIFNPDRQYYDQRLVDRLQGLPGIKLVRTGNVMPWFEQADLFVGDISAAGYEWLYFDRPAVYLNPRPGELRRSPDIASMTYLWRCGDVCDDIRQLPSLIARNLRQDRYQEIREAVLHYSVFGPRDNGAVMRGIRHIEQVLQTVAYA